MHRSLIPVLALALAGCPPTETPETPPGEVVGSDVDRDTDPQVSDADFEQFAVERREFAFDLYHEFADTDGNFVVSPHSVSAALGMTYAGAEGNTETEMADALRFGLEEPVLHSAFNKLDLELQSRTELPAEVEGTAPTLNIVNQTFGQSGYPFEEAFLDTLALHYGAAMAVLDFTADPEASRGVINEWVEEATEEKIQDLLPEGSISSNTKLVLVNAIYFKASWMEPFEVANTTDDPFVLLDGSEISTPTMHGWLEGRYAEGDNWSLVDIPYVGWQISMSILVPDEGSFAEVEAGLNEAFWTSAVDEASSYMIELDLPKFNFRTNQTLSAPLKALGMVEAFEASVADFSGIVNASSLYISEVYHQAFIDVNEEGTEAAAATAVVATDTSEPLSASLDIDRPFIFAIRDRGTGAILFVGRVTNPSAG